MSGLRNQNPRSIWVTRVFFWGKYKPRFARNCSSNGLTYFQEFFDQVFNRLNPLVNLYGQILQVSPSICLGGGFNQAINLSLVSQGFI